MAAKNYKWRQIILEVNLIKNTGAPITPITLKGKQYVPMDTIIPKPKKKESPGPTRDLTATPRVERSWAKKVTLQHPARNWPGKLASYRLKKKVSRRRIRTVIQNLIYLASRVVYHARRYKPGFSRYCPWCATFKRVYLAFA